MTVRDVEYETTTVEELTICDDCGLACGDDAVSYEPDDDELPPIHLHRQCVDNVTLSDDATLTKRVLRDISTMESEDLPIVLALDRLDVGIGILGVIALCAGTVVEGIFASGLFYVIAGLLLVGLAKNGTKNVSTAVEELRGGA